MATSDAHLEEMHKDFAKQERDLEHAVDHQVHTFSASVDFEYNFLSA